MNEQEVQEAKRQSYERSLEFINKRIEEERQSERSVPCFPCSCGRAYFRGTMCVYCWEDLRERQIELGP